jgi:hypothetical protein
MPWEGRGLAVVTALVLGACSPAADRPAAPEPSGDSPPSLNAVERDIVAALADLSLHAERAELPGPESASMWIPSDDETPLQIVAQRDPPPPEEHTVVSERTIAGIRVFTVAHPSGIERERFACGGHEYAVGGAAPPGYDDLDAFLAAFIAMLPCG